MKIYNYNRYTGEYTGPSIATPNPITVGEYLIPAYATTESPPSTTVDELAVWDNGAWIKKDIKEDILEYKWQEIISTRNQLLQASDWTVLVDSPLTTSKKKEWKKYRQELRDLTSTFSKTDTVTWPTKPE